MPDYSNPYSWLPLPSGLAVPVWKAFSFFVLATDSSHRVFNSEGYYILQQVWASFGTASSSGTLQIEYTPTGVAVGSGTNQLDATIALSGTANTPVKGAQVATARNILTPGDSLSVILAGTLTNLVDCCVTLYLERLRK